MVLLAGIVWLLLGAGCKSPDSVNWDRRVGIFTYADAVAELGEPVQKATLSDGTTLGQWIARKKATRTHKILYGGWIEDEADSLDQLLTLSFDKSNVLRAWKMVYK